MQERACNHHITGSREATAQHTTTTTTTSPEEATLAYANQPPKSPTKRKAQNGTKRDNAATGATAGTKAESSPQPDIYQRVTEHIIAAIEAGAGDWKMPWHTDNAGGGSIARPVNAVSGKPYRGVNVLALWAAADAAGYKSHEWATYKQWQEKGAQVRKGEKSSLIVFWKIGDMGGGRGSENGETDDGGKVAEAEQEDRSRPILARGYVVFNADQVDGYTPKAKEEAPTDTTPAQVQQVERIERAEQFFAATGADIRHGGERAYYRKTADYIQMPPFALFRDPIAYYATLGHETAHWTSAKHRLDRDLSGRFGSEAYAAEELIAELSAAFLSADLELTNEPRPDHAAYVATWLKVLKADNRAIFTAAAKAQQAVDYLHGLQEAEPEPEVQAQAAVTLSLAL